jgi:hypothetical protein
MSDNPFVKLAAVDVSKHIEKKQNLSYLSWPFAIDQLMRNDPSANWEFHTPEMYGETMMISCTVTSFGKPIKMHLPVMDHRNQAIKNPNAFEVNKNMMRCLVKAIACHGLGLFIYAGEDLPLDEDGNTAKPAPAKAAATPAAKAPTKVEGKDTEWQLKVVAKPDGDHGEWSQLIIDATMLQLKQAKTEAAVMDIFKTNRNIYNEVKSGSPTAYDVLMSEFKAARAKHKEAA